MLFGIIGKSHAYLCKTLWPYARSQQLYEEDFLCKRYSISILSHLLQIDIVYT